MVIEDAQEVSTGDVIMELDDNTVSTETFADVLFEFDYRTVDLAMQRKKEKRQIGISAILTLLFVIACFGGLVLIFEIRGQSTFYASVQSEPLLDLEIISGALMTQKWWIEISTDRMLRESLNVLETVNFTKSSGNVSFPGVSSLYAQLLPTLELISQSRVIGLDGHEIVRVNYENGKIETVENSRLQNKSNTYYFQAIKTLKAGDVYISPIDFNVDYGNIEPSLVMRTAMPLIDKSNDTWGYLVLNFNATILLKSVPKKPFEDDNLRWLSAISSHGHYIGGPQFWSNVNAMKLAGGERFDMEYPSIWDSIAKRGISGQFYTPEGQWSFRKIYLAEHLQFLNIHPGSVSLVTIPRDMHIVLLDHTGIEFYSNRVFFIVFSVVVFLLVVLGGIGVKFYTDWKYKLNTNRAQDQFQATALRSISDGVIIVNKSGFVVYINAMAEKLTGFSLKDAVNQKLVDVFNFVQEQDPSTGRNLSLINSDRIGERILWAHHQSIISLSREERGKFSFGAKKGEEDGADLIPLRDLRAGSVDVQSPPHVRSSSPKVRIMPPKSRKNSVKPHQRGSGLLFDRQGNSIPIDLAAAQISVSSIKKTDDGDENNGFDGLVLVFADITTRLKQEAEIVKANEQLQAEAKERIIAEQVVVEERERIQKLIYNVLPGPICKRLQAGEYPIADSYENVTVCFADLVHFTDMASKIPAKNLIGILNSLFSRFDSIVESLGLLKIKTTGDEYLVAGGLLDDSPNHVERVATFAQMAMAALCTWNDENSDLSSRLEMRVGIASGPVVAGVIGLQRFVYDIWGDTVNTASRMESTGEPGKIQINSVVNYYLSHESLKVSSQAAHGSTSLQMRRESDDALRRERLFSSSQDGSSFQTIERGSIEVKGKGKMLTFWLCWDREDMNRHSYTDDDNVARFKTLFESSISKEKRKNKMAKQHKSEVRRSTLVDLPARSSLLGDVSDRNLLKKNHRVSMKSRLAVVHEEDSNYSEEEEHGSGLEESSPVEILDDGDGKDAFVDVSLSRRNSLNEGPHLADITLKKDPIWVGQKAHSVSLTNLKSRDLE